MEIENLEESGKYEKLKTKALDDLGYSEDKWNKLVEQKVIAGIDDKKPTMKMEKKVKLANRLLKSRIRGELRSPAKSLDGMVIGASRPFNMSANMHQSARDLYNEDPETAVEKGVTDDDGVPLDPQGKFVNAGEPLPQYNYIRNVYGVAEIDDVVQAFAMALSDTGDTKDEIRDVVLGEIPINKPVTFKANTPGDVALGNMVRLNQSTLTEFVVDESLGVPGAKEIYEMERFDPYRVDLADVDVAFEQTKNEPQRFHLTDATVADRDEEPNENDTFRLTLDSESLALGENPVTAWVPVEVIDQVDSFGTSTDAYVCGRINQNTRDDGDVEYHINVFGMYPYDIIDIEL